MNTKQAVAEPRRRMRGFNVKFKSDTQGCYNVHTIAYSSSDALQNALDEFSCCLKKECAFSVFVSAGPNPDVVRKAVRHGAT